MQRENEPLILQNVNLTIEPGEFVAIAEPYREHIGAVMQDDHLVSGSIADIWTG